MSSMSAFEAAVQYHVNCEIFDRYVCTGGMGRDGVLPANAWELGKINENARMELNLAVLHAKIPTTEMMEVIRDKRVHDEAQRRLSSSVVEEPLRPVTQSEKDKE